MACIRRKLVHSVAGGAVSLFCLIAPVLVAQAASSPEAAPHPPSGMHMPSSPVPDGTLPAAAMASGAHRLTFEEALAAAYEGNPTLRAARAELRGVDETYAQAESGYRPSLTGNASYQSENLDGDADRTHEDPKTLSLTLAQPLYRGGTTTAQMRSAKNTVLSARARLRQTEQQIFLSAITAYLDVLRDQQVVALNVNNTHVLGKQLAAAQARFRLGDITQTDVRQSETRLSNAQAGLSAARGQLESSRAAFESVIGMPALQLATPTQGVTLPATLAQALQEADGQSPDLMAARYAGLAAKADTRAMIGEGLPQVDVSGQVAEVYDPVQSFDDRQTQTSVLLRATMPFYTGGRLDSRVRQARELERQRRLETDKAARAVRQAVIDAWQKLAAARAQSAARKSQIDSALLARDGVAAEARYGSRTTLDVLDAEQEYLNAEVGFVSAEHDRVTAAYSLVAAMGGLSPESLQLTRLGVRSYDAARHFAEIKDKWIGYTVPQPR
jgi:TolC family type I secretion outer membrane protein